MEWNTDDQLAKTAFAGGLALSCDEMFRNGSSKLSMVCEMVPPSA
jgi:hypothetical protein